MGSDPYQPCGETGHQPELPVCIYTIDAGIDVTHPELEGRAEQGMVSFDITEGPHDISGYGTHVASIAVGKTWGAAKTAKLVSCKVMGFTGTGSLSGFINALHFITARVKASNDTRAIMNIDLGYHTFSQFAYDVMQEAHDAGITIVTAAGNSDTSELVYPASHDHAIAVGAMDQNDRLADFTNYGEEVELYAPGVDITGAWPRLIWEVGTNDDGPRTLSGTSMAAGLTSGILARHLATMSDSEVSSTNPRSCLVQRSVMGVLSMSPEQSTGGSHNRLLHKKCDVPHHSK